MEHDPFGHETTVDFEKGRIEELKGQIFILEIENDGVNSPILDRLIESAEARLKAVENNLARISTPNTVN